MEKMTKNDYEYEYIKESALQMLVLSFYIGDDDYHLSYYKEEKWAFYKGKERLEIFENFEKALTNIKVDNKTIYELLVIDKVEYGFT